MNNAIPFRAVLDVLDRLESEAAGGAPVCVAIVNRTGKLAAFLSLDGTPERAGAIAQSKAYTAMRMELTTQAFHDRLVREKPLHRGLLRSGLLHAARRRARIRRNRALHRRRRHQRQKTAGRRRTRRTSGPKAHGKGIERQSKGRRAKGQAILTFSIHIDDSLSVAGRESISGPLPVSPQGRPTIFPSDQERWR